MKRRLATRGGILLPALLALVVYAGCGGNAEVTVVKPNDSPDVAGVVLLPEGVTASATGLLNRIANLIVTRAEALVGVVPAANAPVQVTRYTNENILDDEPIGTVVVGETTTGSDGRYQVPLGNDIIDDCGGGRILVSTDLGGLTRAFAFSDEEDITVDAASEAMVRLIVQAVKQGADLCVPSNADLQQLFALVDSATSDVSGLTVAQINTAAFTAAASDPEVTNFLGEIFEETPATPTVPRTNTPTPTHTPTVGGNTATPTSTVTNTTAPTATNTSSPTSAVSNTPTPTGVTATPTNTSATAPPTPTNTPPTVEVPTDTPTATFTVEVPTDSPTPEDTATPTETIVESTATPTSTIEATATVTQPAARINLDNGSGTQGAQVTITGTLVNSGGAVVATSNDIFFPLADLNIAAADCTLDPRLTAPEIAKQIAVAVTAGTPSGAPPGTRRLRVGIFGTNQNIIPDGTLFSCKFTILAGATDGDKTLTNVPSASGVAGPVPVGGSNGVITVGAGGPTNTPTVVVPTATSVPATATSVPATATEVPATATGVPATATSVPATATSVPATATSVPATATSVPATATPTTGGGGGAQINLNSSSGAPGGTAIITGTLVNSGGVIVSTSNDVFFPLADLNIAAANCTLDPRLTVPEIAKQTAIGVTAGTPTGAPPGTRRLRIGIFGTNQNIIPDGVLFTCTFSILPAATAGDKLLTNVPSASGVSAAVPVTGSNGTITVTGGGGETPTVGPTNTVAAPTATQVPATATQVPATATQVPATATQVPATATQVPPTETQAAATTTPTVGGGGGAQINLSSNSGSAGGTTVITGTLVNSGGLIVSTSNDIFFPLADLNIAAANCTLDSRLTVPEIAKQTAIGVTAGTPTGAPPGTRRLRIGIFGTNQNVIPDGQLFTCTFSILPAASAGAKNLKNVPSASGVSAAVPVTGTDGTITVNP